MYREKFTERKDIVGIYCKLTRGRSVNQRWTVTFMGQEIGKFKTRKLAEQFAIHAIEKAIRDVSQIPGVL